MFTVTLPLEFAATAWLAGLKAHEEFAGTALQARLKVPADPLRGVKVNVYDAA